MFLLISLKLMEAVCQACTRAGIKKRVTPYAASQLLATTCWNRG